MSQLRYLFLLSFLVLQWGCQFEGIVGSGVSKTEVRDVEAFSSIKHSAVANLVVVVGGEHKVEVTFDDNLLELVKTKVDGGVLTIDTTGNYSSRLGNKISVTVPSLDSCTLSGVGSADISGIDGGNLVFNVTGVGALTAKGTADEVTVKCSGVGRVKLGELEAKSVNVKVTGVGSAEVFASESVDASCTGVGGITVLGNPPAVTKSATGIGKIKVGE